MSDKQNLPTGFDENDLFFECPKCGKNMGINRQGAGLVVTCPDCGQRMQVPIPDDLQKDLRGGAGVEDFTQASEIQTLPPELNEKVERLSITMDELKRRKQFLESKYQECLARMERVRDEIALMQASLDRMVDSLADADFLPRD